MNGEASAQRRYFSTYTGIRLPIKLSQPLEESAITNRNTYFLGFFDTQDRMTGFQKMVYGEIELEHRYEYHANGALKQAEILDAERVSTLLAFDIDGVAV